MHDLFRFCRHHRRRRPRWPSSSLVFDGRVPTPVSVIQSCSLAANCGRFHQIIPNDNSGRAFGTFGRPAVFDCLGAVFDRLGAVFDRFAVVFDRFGAVFDRLGAVIDRKTAPKRSI